jgi:hypothetical protein
MPTSTVASANARSMRAAASRATGGKKRRSGVPARASASPYRFQTRSAPTAPTRTAAKIPAETRRLAGRRDGTTSSSASARRRVAIPHRRSTTIDAVAEPTVKPGLRAASARVRPRSPTFTGRTLFRNSLA